MDNDWKKTWRSEALARRDALTTAQRREYSERLCQSLVAESGFATAQTCLLYMNMGSECDTSPLVEAVLSSHHRLVLPRVDPPRRRLTLHRVSDPNSELIPGPWSIREPWASAPAVPLAEIDFILAPGVLFDGQCRRLGYGGGYYDRLLAQPDCRAWVLALAFDEQWVPELQEHPHDRPVDGVITPTRQFWRRRA